MESSNLQSRSGKPPQVGEAHLRIREDGRQLVIDRGFSPTDLEPKEQEEEDDACSSSGADSDEEESTAKRGRITTFSEASRRRLRGFVHSLRRDAESTFLTLTWHRHCPDPEEAKRALDNFLKRMRRRFPDASAVWKLEPQKRGFPHYHLLVYGLPFIPYEKLTAIWHECTQEVSDQHRESGVDVERSVHNDDGKLQSYLAKYMSKEMDGWPTEKLHGDTAKAWEHPGRFWGVFNRDALPRATWADWAAWVPAGDATWLIETLLREWGVDIPEGVIPPRMVVNVRGDPVKDMEGFLARMEARQ